MEEVKDPEGCGDGLGFLLYVLSSLYFLYVIFEGLS